MAPTPVYHEKGDRKKAVKGCPQSETEWLLLLCVPHGGAATASVAWFSTKTASKILLTQATAPGQGWIRGC